MVKNLKAKCCDSGSNNNNNDPVKFYASYRIGNGRIGNVGSETIKRIVKNKDNKDIVEKLKSIYNPLPAIGGTDHESLNESKTKCPYCIYETGKGCNRR